ncbi:MAG: phosphatidylserine/phosphatidylglycerophosphate/cardiolipin synthase family protein [Burkholderiales bacterium]|nr:phosphatidylserine/phosphatidylglycerophosphate/cardiolipin synthase family protein [Burkholderiales bacterium]
MPPALLTAVLSALMRALQRLGWPRALGRLGPGEVRSYAAGVAYMLQARAWSLMHGVPAWPAVHRAWADAEGDTALRDALAGRLHPSDRLELIADGAEGFARREALYAGARHSIDIASYYLQSDDTGRATVRALAAAVQRGVRVRLLVDRFMTFKKTQEVEGLPALLAEAQAAGIELRQWHDRLRPCDSNHRKMIVVDGTGGGIDGAASGEGGEGGDRGDDRRVALVGGRNFADHYRGNAWRDVDLVLQGPSVVPLAALFEAVWAGAAPGACRGDAAHPKPPWLDHVPAGILADPMMRFVLAAVGAARAQVQIELAYFVAHEPLCDALARAARRGVRVRLLTNSAESNDLPFATWTTYEGVRRLLEGGCEVRLRRGAGCTLHCKYMVVDGRWVSFGSHNLDYFSPRFCCETNLVVRDERLATSLLDFFDTGWAEAEPATLPDVQRWLAGAGGLRWFDRIFRDFQ